MKAHEIPRYHRIARKIFSMLKLQFQVIVSNLNVQSGFNYKLITCNVCAGLKVTQHAA